MEIRFVSSLSESEEIFWVAFVASTLHDVLALFPVWYDLEVISDRGHVLHHHAKVPAAPMDRQHMVVHN